MARDPPSPSGGCPISKVSRMIVTDSPQYKSSSSLGSKLKTTRCLAQQTVFECHDLLTQICLWLSATEMVQACTTCNDVYECIQNAAMYHLLSHKYSQLPFGANLLEFLFFAEKRQLVVSQTRLCPRCISNIALAKWISCSETGANASPGEITAIAEDGHAISIRAREYGLFGDEYSQIAQGYLDTSRYYARIPSVEWGSVCQLSRGDTHSAIVTKSGELYTWGRGGGIGHGDDNGDCPVPRLVLSLQRERVIQVACGSRHTLVMTHSCRVFSFGDRDSKALGREASLVDSNAALPRVVELYTTPSVSSSSSDVSVDSRRSSTSVAAVSISCGAWHSAVLGADGKVYTFGTGARGRLGLGNTADQIVPKSVDLLAATCHGQATCLCAALPNSNTQTRLHHPQASRPRSFSVESHGCGHPSCPSNLSPNCEDTFLTVVQLSCGDAHTVVLTKQGKVYSWGDNEFGQLMRFCSNKDETQVGDGIFSCLPGQVNGVKRVVMISAGDARSAVLDCAGSVYMFGASLELEPPPLDEQIDPLNLGQGDPDDWRGLSSVRDTYNWFRSSPTLGAIDEVGEAMHDSHLNESPTKWQRRRLKLPSHTVIRGKSIVHIQLEHSRRGSHEFDVAALDRIIFLVFRLLLIIVSATVVVDIWNPYIQKQFTNENSVWEEFELHSSPADGLQALLTFSSNVCFAHGQ